MLLKVYLVTGGQGSSDVYLASTELFHPDATTWVSSEPLPSARIRLRSIVLNSKILITGALLMQYFMLF